MTRLPGRNGGITELACSVVTSPQVPLTACSIGLQQHALPIQLSKLRLQGHVHRVVAMLDGGSVIGKCCDEE